MFFYSLKLFRSNWLKALKYLLFYFAIWGICFAMLLPLYFAFVTLIKTNFQQANLISAFSGVFKTSLGGGLYTIFTTCYSTFLDACNQNLGLVIYGLFVLFVVLPFLINVGKYTYSSMLYSYMTSKAKVGFFSACVKSLSQSTLYALAKTFYNLFFWVIVVVSTFGIGMISNQFFVSYFLPVVEVVLLVCLFTFNHLITLGWMSALIVFNCNIFSAFAKGLKAVRRHFWATFGTVVTCFFLFWVIVLIFGVYSLVVLVPILSAWLCTLNMVTFFSSQGMRFYYNETNILTPKKLEEVDNINKTAFIL